MGSFDFIAMLLLKEQVEGLHLWSYDEVCYTLYLIRIMHLFIMWVEEKIYFLNDTFPLLIYLVLCK